MTGKRPPKRRVPQPKSAAEEEFRILYESEAKKRGLNHPLLRNFRFHPNRKWELDYAVRTACWPIAVELQGMFSDGGLSKHRRIQGMLNDYRKQNAAQELGWIVLVGTREMIPELVKQLLRMLSPPRRSPE